MITFKTISNGRVIFAYGLLLLRCNVNAFVNLFRWVPFYSWWISKPAWPGMVLVLFASISPGLEAAHIKIGLVKHHTQGSAFSDEWAWALRGGGANLETLTYRDLTSLNSEIQLLIIDNAPLDEAAGHALENWVHKGGLLVYAGANAALQKVDDRGAIHKTRELHLSKLVGASFAGFDQGLIGVYPDIVVSSALLSPLKAGDALRLGADGVGHAISLEATDAEILARGTRLSPGPNGITFKSTIPTILSKPFGQGRVVFLTFSPAWIARCYPKADDNEQAQDCTGASQAHALMRWLTANLLWEERQIQLPLLWEAPGDRPHAVIVTGDVHQNPFEVTASTEMGKLFNELELPLSLYVVGQIAKDFPGEFDALQQLKDLEISPHSASGKVYWTKRFKFTGVLGILHDLKKAQKLLEISGYPSNRDWLISTRNESWQSDQKAWWAMEREGVGLVFDHIADTTENRSLYWAPRLWFDGGERQRIFVPLFERSISTPVDNFRLKAGSERNIAALSSAQAEPCCIPLSYPAYTRYVERWHALFDRLAMVGGLTEVWLWHPGGVALKSGFTNMVDTLEKMKREPSVSILRGDVVATWRFNRELQQITIERNKNRAIVNMKLRPTEEPLKPMPPGAPAFASSTSYWVLGSLNIPKWTSREWTDTMGRTVSVLVHPLAN